MLIGSHLSSSGGPANALRSAETYRFDTVALFVRNNTAWRAAELTDEAVEEFRNERQRLDIGPVVAHGMYLVNLAGEEPTRGKSLQAVADELRRCDRLGIEYLVYHPGSRPDTDEGIDMIADGLNDVLADDSGQTTLLLETTAGQGNCIGHRFEHLAAIRDRIDQSDRVAVCLDTCHIFAAGYDIRTAEGWADTMSEFDRIVGLDLLKAIHLNDSKRDFASRVDRHEHIGKGFIGKEGFRAIVTDSRLAETPMILETPKGTTEKGSDYDDLNANTLYRLAGKKRPRKR